MSLTKTVQRRESSWLLLTYKVPPEPSKLRVAIWRRIRGLGAAYLQNGICVLPTTTDHERQFRIVQSEIVRAGGEAVLEAYASEVFEREHSAKGALQKGPAAAKGRITRPPAATKARARRSNQRG